MVERWSSKPYVWVRFLLLLFIFNINSLNNHQKLNNVLKKTPYFGNVNFNKVIKYSNSFLNKNLPKKQRLIKNSSIRYLKYLNFLKKTNFSLPNSFTQLKKNNYSPLSLSSNSLLLLWKPSNILKHNQTVVNKEILVCFNKVNLFFSYEKLLFLSFINPLIANNKTMSKLFTDRFSLTTFPLIFKNSTLNFKKPLTSTYTPLNVNLNNIGHTEVPFFHSVNTDLLKKNKLFPFSGSSKFTNFLLFLDLSKKLSFLIPKSKNLNTYLLTTYDVNSKHLIRLDNQALFFNLKAFSNKASLFLDSKKQIFLHKQLTSSLNENNLENLLETYIDYRFKGFKSNLTNSFKSLLKNKSLLKKKWAVISTKRTNRRKGKLSRLKLSLWKFYEFKKQKAVFNSILSFKKELYFSHFSPDIITKSWVINNSFKKSSATINPNTSYLEFFFRNTSLLTFVLANNTLFKYVYTLITHQTKLSLTTLLLNLNSSLFGSTSHPILNSNLLVTKSFSFSIQRRILKIFSYDKFSPNVTMWYYNTLIRFIENCTGKKVFVKFNPFIENSLTFNDLARCNLWAFRVQAFQKLLGPKLFLKESLKILHISFRYKDPTFLSNWIRGMLKRMSFWKYKLLFRYLKYVVRHLFQLHFKELGFKGFKLKLKGKISVAGNARTRTLFYRIGNTSHSTFDNKVAYDLSYVNTFTGVLGFKLWFFF